MLEALGIREDCVELVTEQRMTEHGLLGDRAPGQRSTGGKPGPGREQVLEWLRAALTAEAA